MAPTVGDRQEVVPSFFGALLTLLHDFLLFYRKGPSRRMHSQVRPEGLDGFDLVFSILAHFSSIDGLFSFPGAQG